MHRLQGLPSTQLQGIVQLNFLPLHNTNPISSSFQYRAPYFLPSFIRSVLTAVFLPAVWLKWSRLFLLCVSKFFHLLFNYPIAKPIPQIYLFVLAAPYFLELKSVSVKLPPEQQNEQDIHIEMFIAKEPAYPLMGASYVTPKIPKADFQEGRLDLSGTF